MILPISASCIAGVTGTATMHSYWLRWGLVKFLHWDGLKPIRILHVSVSSVARTAGIIHYIQTHLFYFKCYFFLTFPALASGVPHELILET
jgi:hypothetical protein